MLENKLRNSNPAAVGSYGVSWTVLVWLAALYVLVFGNKMLNDPDTYWHTAVGDWILKNGAIPRTDPFSHSLPGTPWTAHEWLSEVVFSVVHSLAGWDGLVVLTALTFAATLAGMTRFLLRQRIEAVYVLLIVALSGGMMASHLLARPHSLVAPLLALWLAVLVSARDRDAPPPFWLLPVISLWANLHGSFTLGLALAFALGLEAILAGGRQGWASAARQWGLFLLLALLAALLTPFHWNGLLFTAHVMSLGKTLSMIGEWRSPDFQVFQVFEVWLLALLAAALSGRLRLPLVRLLIILGMTHLSLKHGRYIAVTAIVVPFLLAAPFARHWQAAPALGDDCGALDRLFAALARPSSAGVKVLVAAITVLIGGLAVMQHPYAPRQSITPAAALDALRAADVPGPVFNDYNFGGYLIHAGVPVFIDGRADMYGDPFLEKYDDATRLRSSDGLTRLLAEHRISATMLAPKTPAVALLDHLPGWRRLYADEIAIVHVRSP